MKTVLITGSTRGIGLGLARSFLELGANVVVTGRGQAQVERTSAELAARFGSERVLGVAGDVTRCADVERMWREAQARFGRIDIWINNAGATTTPVPLDQVPPEEIARTIDTNLLGTLYGCKVAIAGMRAQGGGQIYNVEGLGSAGQTQVGLTTYGCTKAAVAYLKKSLLRELEGTSVQICAIRPGVNVTEHLLYGAHALPEARWQSTKKIFNILGDKPETTTPWIAKEVLANQTNGRLIQWLSTAKVAYRFMTAGFKKRDLFVDIDEKRLRTPS